MQTKYAYLTIDDAPSEDMGNKIDYLDSKGIKATWFVRGELIEENLGEVIHAIRQGHLIGNHSWDHPKFSELSFNACRGQIYQTDQLIEKAYFMAGRPRLIKLFRFPFLDKGAGYNYQNLGWDNPHVMALQEVLKRMGYRQPSFAGITYEWWQRAGLPDAVDVDCTFDTYDWAPLEDNPPHGYKGLTELLARMDEDLPEEGRGLNYTESEDIILMHDFTETADMFSPMIDHLLNKGIVFKLPE